MTHPAPSPSPVPPRIVGMICRAAVARGLLRGRREAILERLESMGRDLFGPGAEFFSAVFTAAGEDGEAFPEFRTIGDLFWKIEYASVEKRRLSGSYYTPVAVIDHILDLVWDDLFPEGGVAATAGSSVCDPAMGCGYFLVRAAERLLDANPGEAGAVRKWARKCLYGVDKDVVSVFLARVFLWLTLSEPGREFVPDPAHFACGDSLLGPAFREAGREADGGGDALDWSAAFPEAARAGGFAAVVGNPPYEVLTNFSRYPERSLLASALRTSGRYEDALTGQINLYRCFIERSLALLRPGGNLSMIVPLSLARDAAAAPLRRRLIEREGAERWALFGERDRIFSGVTQSACIFRAVRGGGSPKTLQVTAGGAETRLPLTELRDFGGEGLGIPILDERGMALWRWLWRNCHGRLEALADMRVGEVDQTFYRDCMRDDDTGCLLARGAHLSPFRLDTEAAAGRERFLELALFLQKKGGAAEACRKRAAEWRVAQLGIRNLHSRPRLIAALVPPGVYLGNSLNVYAPREGVAIEYLAGLLNSRLLDWLFRAGSGNNNINLHEMRRLLLPATPSAGMVQAVIRAYEECMKAAADPERLSEVRRLLDNAVEACYGVPETLLAALEEKILPRRRGHSTSK